MRSLAIVVLLALPLAGMALAPSAPAPPAEATLEPTTADPVPAPPAEAVRCVPILAAERAASHIRLTWTGCDADRYLVHAGPSAAELAPIVEVDHPNHVDLLPEWATAVYAVSTPEGALSEPVAIPLG